MKMRVFHGLCCHFHSNTTLNACKHNDVWNTVALTRTCLLHAFVFRKLWMHACLLTRAYFCLCISIQKSLDEATMFLSTTVLSDSVLLWRGNVGENHCQFIKNTTDSSGTRSVLGRTRPCFVALKFFWTFRVPTQTFKLPHFFLPISYSFLPWLRKDSKFFILNTLRAISTFHILF